MTKAVAAVVREPDIYNPESRWSFFADLARAEVGDLESKERLLRHQEVASEQQRSEQRRADDARRVLEAAGVEFRVNPNATLGQGGEFLPPAWLIPLFGAQATAGRVL